MPVPSGLGELLKFFRRATDGIDPFYEEGTWTPTIQDTSLSDDESQTYSVNEGTYIRIGNKVFCEGHIVMTSLGSLTTSAGTRLAGLPFTAKNDNQSRGSITISNATSISTLSGETVTGLIQHDTTYAILYKWDSISGVTSFLLSELTAAGNIYFTIEYTTE